MKALIYGIHKPQMRCAVVLLSEMMDYPNREVQDSDLVCSCLCYPDSCIPNTEPEILSRIAQTTAWTRLKRVWNNKSISLSSMIRPNRSLVTSIFLYACESWALTAELQRRIQATKMRCYRKILHISYKDHVSNEEVRAKIQ